MMEQFCAQSFLMLLHLSSTTKAMKSITLLFLLLVTALFSSGQDKFYYNSYNEIHCLQVQGDKLWAGTTKGLVLRDN